MTGERIYIELPNEGKEEISQGDISGGSKREVHTKYELHTPLSPPELSMKRYARRTHRPVLGYKLLNKYGTLHSSSGVYKNTHTAIVSYDNKKLFFSLNFGPAKMTVLGLKESISRI